jgi:hypothetical protein
MLGAGRKMTWLWGEWIERPGSERIGGQCTCFKHTFVAKQTRQAQYAQTATRTLQHQSSIHHPTPN